MTGINSRREDDGKKKAVRGMRVAGEG
jgi:hypothetical protein